MRLFLILCLLWFVGWSAPVQATTNIYTAELQLFNMTNRLRLRQGVPALQLDKQASQLARRHSQSMAEKNFFALDSPQYGSLDYQLTYHRVNGKPYSLIARARQISHLFEDIQKDPFLLSKELTHSGIGIHLTEDSGKLTYWLTFILLEKVVTEITPIPRTLNPGESIQIQGSLRRGFTSPQMPVTFPNGRVKTFENLSRESQKFLFRIPFDQGKGQYTLELLVEENDSPKVADIYPVFVGMPYPTKAPDKPAQAKLFKTTDQAAEHMVYLVNRAREAHDLRPLSEDSLLEYVAYLHSEDMATKKYFSHLNLQKEDPNQRFRKYGGYGPVGENIVSDATVDAAFKQLMNSPGHRASILSTRYTHIGVGVYHDGHHYFITQLFQVKYPKVNPYYSANTLLEWLNQERRKIRKPAIQADLQLHRAALAHSKSMATELRLSYESGGSSFVERYAQQKGKARELNTLIFLARSLDEAKEQLLKNRNTFLDQKWSHAGIGIHQGPHPNYGENILWITIGLGAEE